MKVQQKLPIGISDFKVLREKDRYFVDKTMFIKEVWDNAGEIILFPRPRRFGKTLNLSMLRYFFEKTEEILRWLFEPYAIAQDEEMMSHQGQYPVIFLTFKDIKVSHWEECLEKTGNLIANEFQRIQQQFDLSLTPQEEEYFEKILYEQGSKAQLEVALQQLTQFLFKTTHQKVIVLIDEYDAPIHSGYQFGYYEEIVTFMRNLLSGAYKDNSCLQKGVITGILRVAKESIFSGLNNLDVYSILRPEFSHCFGFTQIELEQLIEDFEVSPSDELQRWYNGYQFGNKTIYNPWSIINYINSEDRFIRTYWLNSSANELVRELIINGPMELEGQVEQLLSGEAISCPLDDNIVLRDIDKTPQTIWNLLVFSGYLKPIQLKRKGNRLVGELAIPNQEVLLFFEDTIQNWLSQQIGDERLQSLLKSLLTQDEEMFEGRLQEMVLALLSFHDTQGELPERVYHAFVLGLLLNLQSHYHLHSNKESGYGRYDLLLHPKKSGIPGYVIEFKKRNPRRETNVDMTMKNALKQIREKEYASQLREAGIAHIIGIGIVVEGKEVWVEWLDLSIKS